MKLHRVPENRVLLSACRQTVEPPLRHRLPRRGGIIKMVQYTVVTIDKIQMYIIKAYPKSNSINMNYYAHFLLKGIVFILCIMITKLLNI